MSKEKRRVPKLRFPGFTEDWEQCKLGSIGSTYTGLSGKTKEDFGHGEAQYITYLNVFQNTVSDITMTDKVEIDTTQNEVKYGDVLFTTSSETPEEVGMSSVWLGHTPNIYLNSFCFGFRPNQKIDPYFLGYSLRAPYMRDKIKILAQGISRYNISKNKVMELEISLPNNEEQSLLGIFLRNIDLGITLHQRKLDNLKLKKKALLQKLFPKNGERYPELRFPGFTDAWEQREFSDIFAEVKSGLSRMLSNDDIGLPVVRANNINDGQLNLVDDIKYWYKNDPQGANTNNYLIEQGDILINFINSEAKMGTAAYVTRRPERDTIYTTNILRCKVNDEYNPYFIYSLTFLNSYKNYIASITKPAVNQASFTTVDFKKYSIKIPTVKEQNQIADLIKTFNKLITLHQRKLDHLQLQKNALLQQMFV